MRWPLESTYTRLPARLFARVPPTPVKAPRLVKINDPLAELLGLDPKELASPSGLDVLAGNAVPEGSEPIALAYAGHQFGSFVRLGDGRAILLGELMSRDGKRRDVQLKGAGRTPFSRQGDGRAALGPVLREYIVSEAMAALGVPTTRALAAVTTGELVYREEAIPGAVLTRVAASHIRVGTFELLAALGDREALIALTDHALARHFPDSVGADNAAQALLDRVVEAQASLVARWLGLGFVHGVMNTDNTSISGETIDYGPCAFLDEYDPRKKFSSIDHQGRYAYANQPRIAGWNLARLAESLLPLLDDEEDRAVQIATEHIERFAPRFEAAYTAVVRAKLGLEGEEESDLALAQDLLAILAGGGVDFTLFFRELCDAAEDPAADAKIAAMLEDPEPFHAWAKSWRARLARDERGPHERASAMRRANPAFIPRNHRVEEAIDAAIRRAEFAPFETLVRVLGRPYEAQPDAAHLAEAPRPEERVTRTFCGT